MKEIIFRCLCCKSLIPSAERVNKPWTGWTTTGTLTNLDNFCCPNCGSNDLVYRAPQTDAKCA